MLSVTTTIDRTSGGVKIAWTAPISNSDPISKYILEIKDNSNNYYENTAYCNGASPTIIANRYCIIPMTVFRSSPYYLVYPELIVVRAKAFNHYGWSTVSNVNAQGATVRREPLSVQNLQRGLLTSIS